MRDAAGRLPPEVLSSAQADELVTAAATAFRQAAELQPGLTSMSGFYASGLRTLVAAASLVLCTAALTAWLRSVHRYDRINYTAVDRSQCFHRTWVIESNAGQCGFGRVSFALDRPAANPKSGWDMQSSARSLTPLSRWPPYRPSAFSTEFSFQSSPPTKTTLYGSPGTFRDWSVTFPHWTAVVLLLVMAFTASSSAWKRFSLRRLFAVMTIIAVILGAAVWLNS